VEWKGSLKGKDRGVLLNIVIQKDG
jgi:hypothetical protein